MNSFFILAKTILDKKILNYENKKYNINFVSYNNSVLV